MKFHPGELAIQTELGVRAMAERVGQSIHSSIPEGALEWLAEQRLAAAATLAPDGSVWVSLLTGPAGFLLPHDETTLRIQPDRVDPLLQSNLATDDAIGLVILAPAFRQRLRVNGTAHLEAGALTVTAKQAYANCPKYIQTRHIVETTPAAPSESETGTALSHTHRHLIENADTFFIGSSYEGAADASHRGGNPGFVHAVSETRLTWLDYPGNTMFNTFGNLHENPNCGLLFIDWETGQTLQLTGRAVLEQEDERIRVQFDVDRWKCTQDATPQHWQLDQFSPFNPPA